MAHRKIKFGNLPLILIAGVIFIVMLHYWGVLAPLENIIVKIIMPFQSATYSTGNKFINYFKERKDYGDLIVENKKLTEQIRNYLIENEKLKNIISEEKIIKEQLDFLMSMKLNYILAGVIGRDYLAGQNVLIINKGEKDGIIIGAPVVVDQGVLIGKIIKVEDNFSHFLLITDPSSQTAGNIETVNSPGGIKGIIIGEHGLSMRMELIPQEEKIIEGDLVVTSSIEEGLPSGLIIGPVTRVQAIPNSFFQIVYLRSLSELTNLHIVSVLIK